MTEPRQIDGCNALKAQRQAITTAVQIEICPTVRAGRISTTRPRASDDRNTIEANGSFAEAVRPDD